MYKSSSFVEGRVILVDKTWLETHIWHAKRMHMENLWGYRLATTPTEKSFRPSHRASLHGCILHDASYEAIIELKGPEVALQKILNDCSDPQVAGPGAQRWFTVPLRIGTKLNSPYRYLTGSRACRTLMYKAKSYPFGLIGPVEVLWCPVSDKSPQKRCNAPSNKSRKKNAKNSSTRNQKSSRVAWIKCHPSIFEDVISAIHSPIQLYLRDAKEAGDNYTEIEIADLRDRFNVFQLIGPKSSQVIHGALSLVKQDDRSESKEVSKGKYLGHLPRVDATVIVLECFRSATNCRICAPGNDCGFERPRPKTSVSIP